VRWLYEAMTMVSSAPTYSCAPDHHHGLVEGRSEGRLPVRSTGGRGFGQRARSTNRRLAGLFGIARAGLAVLGRIALVEFDRQTLQAKQNLALDQLGQLVDLALGEGGETEGSGGRSPGFALLFPGRRNP
jgi:hypothetical protein